MCCEFGEMPHACDSNAYFNANAHAFDFNACFNSDAPPCGNPQAHSGHSKTRSKIKLLILGREFASSLIAGNTN